MEMEKAYNPKTTEEKIYRLWENSGCFNPDKLPTTHHKLPTTNYIIYMPLPNVTGSLHMGHTLDNTLQDILIRYNRMKGYRALWLPGTDHAGIATQYVVEKELKKQGISRFSLGRKKFIEKVWEWKSRYGNAIIGQLKKLGASADWSRLRFTMDEEYARDVISAFIHYHKKGLIYRGNRVVNWCPRCGTSLSELELEYKDEKTKLWHIKYNLKSQVSNLKYITVATTRPETMLGDTAVAVNPKDKRYKKLIGQIAILPIKNRKIPIIADDAIDIKFGTGAVKVTPAHDTADFEIGERHKLPITQVIDERGKMSEEAGEEFNGFTTKEARDKIIAKLNKLGLLEKEEEYGHRVAICYRCSHTIEPIPSLQWFLKMNELAKSARKAVESGRVKITPKNFEKMYFSWLTSIKDWTISRQIWWGHQLPVFFCKRKQGEIRNSKFEIRNKNQNISSKNTEENFIISVEKPKKCPLCGKCSMEQSTDVLDTWFSSALWPFAGLSQKDQKKYYPGTTLITARDILNLWVARMIFSGLEFRGAVPFKNVIIHGTILTKDGKRMSKSLGTGVDPLSCIDQYGADATRFGVVWQATGQDIRWGEAAVIAGKKFCNKIWNASRFVITSVGDERISLHGDIRIHNPKFSTKSDLKILKSLYKTKRKVEKDMAAFEFSRALRALYDFFWHEFCDIYLEKSKLQLSNEKLAQNTRRILIYTLFESLKMLHPFIPFLTEEIYQKLPIAKKDKMIMISPWESSL